MKTVFKLQKGRFIHSYDVEMEISEDSIVFKQSAFDLKDEIKAMEGARWLGFDKPKPRKVWSVANTPGNCFRIRALQGEDVYENWDQPLIELTKEDLWRPEFDVYDAELGDHQLDAIRRTLTSHYFLCAAEPGMGKSLSAVIIAEQSGVKDWWYVGPASALRSVELEFEKWNLDPSVKVRMMSYNELTKIVKYDLDTLVAPHGLIFDEASKMKNGTSHRARAGRAMADKIRLDYGFDGYALLLTGTPCSKKPVELHSQLEIAWPGYLREGSVKAFELRYAITEWDEGANGTRFQSVLGWNEEEVAKLPDRYDGLMKVYRKEDYLDLPKKIFKVVRLEPSKKVLRVGRSLVNVAPNTITAMNYLRQLSSGFQYTTEADGTEICGVCLGSGMYNNPSPETCPSCGGAKETVRYKRETLHVDTPKDQAVRDLLAKEDKRVVLMAAFQGSVDHCIKLCNEEGWSVCAVDGRGWRVYNEDGEKLLDQDVMDHWIHYEGKVAFVGNPESCGYGLTLTLAKTMIFYENSFKAEIRLQAIDRVHRMGIKESPTIVDLVHLPIDQLVLDTLNMNQKLEHLSMGILEECLRE